MPTIDPPELTSARAPNFPSPPPYERFDSNPPASDAALSAVALADDRFERVSSRRFSPLCQRVLAREHHRALALPMPKMPVAEARLHYPRLAKDIELLVEDGFTPEMLQPLIDLAAGDQLLNLLARDSVRLQAFGFEPSTSAQLVYDLHVKQQLSAFGVERRIIALRLNNIDAACYEQLAVSPLGHVVMALIDKACRRLSLLPLAGETFVAAAQSANVFIQLNGLMYAWNFLLQTGISDEDVPSMLWLGNLEAAALAHWTA